MERWHRVAPHARTALEGDEQGAIWRAGYSLGIRRLRSEKLALLVKHRGHRDIVGAERTLAQRHPPAEPGHAEEVVLER